MRGRRWLLLLLLGAGCWVYRTGPNYEYEPVGDGWQARPDLRQYSIWNLERDGVTWKTDVWRYRGDMLILALSNTTAAEKRVRLHAPQEAAFRWRPGQYGDSGSAKEQEARYGTTWITIPARSSACLKLSLADLRGTSEAREGDRVRFAIEDALGRLDCEFRLERISYDYRLLPAIGD